MNNLTSFPLLQDKKVSEPAAISRRKEYRAVMHELRNQACTLSLGIAALKYPEESEEMKHRHLTALETVIIDMIQQFQRLDNCISDAGCKPIPRKLENA
ncbi:MAG: hypothetical protein OEN50_14780 [Deltaproteobacteria bacterium]|nr:hypothetical protein [Deltaproteobacteria bacterium]